MIRSNVLRILCLAAIVLIAATVRLWRLEAGGWGAEYYSAAVYSMSQSWHNFFHAAFDPAGFISVDKPPLSLWLQVASVKLFGFTPAALQWPQVLQGVAAVVLLFHLVRRRFGFAAGGWAALFFALTPIWIAVNRTNITDTCLVLTLLLAAWLLIVAVESGRVVRLCAAMAMIGVAFNVKMLAAYVVLPAFLLVWLVCGRCPLPRRVGGAVAAVTVMVACSLPWVLWIEGTPAAERPYVGSSRHNSMLELVVGHNATSRFVATWRTGREASPSAATLRASPGSDAVGRDPAARDLASRDAAGRDSGRRSPADSAADDAERSAAGPSGPARALRLLASRLLAGGSPPGPVRLFTGQFPAQYGWWLPLALLAPLALLRPPRSATIVPAADPNARRYADAGAGAGAGAGAAPYGDRVAALPDLLLWAGWALTYLVLYSVMGGILHFYYLSTLAPALAALAGIGIVAAWRVGRSGGRAAWLLPLALPVTAAWQWHVHHTGLAAPAGLALSPVHPWPQWLLAAAGIMAAVAAAGLMMQRSVRPHGVASPAGEASPVGAGSSVGAADLRPSVAARLHSGPRADAVPVPRPAFGLAGLGLAGLLLLPLAWGASSVLTPGPGIAPNADLYRLIAATSEDGDRLAVWRARSRQQFARLSGFIRGRQHGERFLLATSTTEVAAPVILATGLPVMARGGFSGTDPALSPQTLASEVAAGRLRYVLLGDLSPVFRRLGAERAGAEIEAWVRANGRPVDPSAWRGGLRFPRAELFDLAPPGE